MAVPRLCCMRLDDQSPGYGFSLVAKKSETGQFIDEVKPGSLAEKAGLKDEDFLVEVNGRNILALSHPEVVEIIKASGKEVSLLVIDSAARAHYDQNSIVVTSAMPEVNRICSWSEAPTIEVHLTEDQQPFSEQIEETEPEAPYEVDPKESKESEEAVEEATPSLEVPEPELKETEEEEKEEEKVEEPEAKLVEETKEQEEAVAEVELPAEAISETQQVTVDVVVEAEEEEGEEENKPVVKEPEAVKEAEKQEQSPKPKLGEKPKTPSVASVRATPSRRARMGVKTSFGDRAKVFDAL